MRGEFVDHGHNNEELFLGGRQKHFSPSDINNSSPRDNYNSISNYSFNFIPNDNNDHSTFSFR